MLRVQEEVLGGFEPAYGCFDQKLATGAIENGVIRLCECEGESDAQLATRSRLDSMQSVSELQDICRWSIS